MKKLILVLFFVLVLSFNVFAATDLGLVVTDPVDSVDPGEFANFTLDITNNNLDTNITVTVTTSDATSVSGTIDLVSSESSTTVIVPNKTTIRIFRGVSVPSNTLADTYDGTFQISASGQDPISRAYEFEVTEEPSLEITPLEVDLESGEDDVPFTLTITNNGNTPITELLSTLTLSASESEDSDGDKITIRSPDHRLDLDLEVGDVVVFTFFFDVDSGFDISTVNANLVIDSNELDLTRPFKINIKPLSCVATASSSDLSVKIQSPDDSDELDFGDVVKVELDIKNKAEDSMDVTVEAVLYDTDTDEEVDSQTTTQRIKHDKTETITFDLNFDDTADPDDSYDVYFKVYDDDNEDETCKNEEVSLDIQVPDHKININNPTLTPTVVECGMSRLSASALLRNVGDNDETVVFDIYNTQIGLVTPSQTFELSEGTDDDSEATVNLGFNLPSNVTPGTYSIYFRAKYSREESMITLPITVLACNNIQNNNAGNTASPGSAASTGNVGSTQPNPITGTTVYTGKSIFDSFSSGSSVPTSVWVLIDVLLGVLILASLVWLLKR